MNGLVVKTVNCLFERAWLDFANPPPKDHQFRSSGLSGECELKYYLDLVDPINPAEGSDESTLDAGTWIHADDNWQLSGAAGVATLENFYAIKLRSLAKNAEPWFVTGSMDRLRVHPRIGFYPEDVKSKEVLDMNKCYMLLKSAKNKDFGFPAYIKQVSIYAFFEFVINKRIMNRGRIRFIGQNDPLFEMCIPIDLMPWEETQNFLLNHPTIQSCLTRNPQIVIEAARKHTHFSPDSFPCSWCDHLKSCPLMKDAAASPEPATPPAKKPKSKTSLFDIPKIREDE